MAIPDADWKNQGRQIVDWFALLVAGVLALLYLYQGLLIGDRLPIGLAALFGVWGVLYLTDYWQPILYLVMAIVVLTVTISWLLVDAPDRLLVQASIVLNLVFVGCCLYLFNAEELTLYPFQH